MRTAQNYQEGHIQRDGRRKTWSYRWWVKDATGKWRHRGKKIGTFQQYPNEKAARRAAEVLRAEINRESVTRPENDAVSFSKVMDAYIVEEMPNCPSTRRGYLSKLKNHVRPKWGDRVITSVVPAEVEVWLNALVLGGKSKQHVRGMLRILVDSAMRRGWIPNSRNFVELVRVRESKKRRRRIAISIKQFQDLLRAITHPATRVMVILAACIGLRASEIVGLTWDNIDWINKTLTIQRGVVEGHVGPAKTRLSHETLPLHDKVISALQEWRAQAPFTGERAWVFGSEVMGGTLPWSSRYLQTRYLRSAAIQVGIGAIGFHALRHQYRSALSINRVPLDIQQALMRHSNLGMTMDYGMVVDPSKREANDLVVDQLMS